MKIVISPCRGRVVVEHQVILARNCCTTIAMGNLNINVAFSVLGLCSEEERDQYLSSLRTFTNERIMCMEVLTAKNGAQQMCSQRVMRGKEICSYHARSLRFRANTNWLRGNCKRIYIQNWKNAMENTIKKSNVNFWYTGSGPYMSIVKCVLFWKHEPWALAGW